jgi:hypothetical protein
MNTMGKRGLIRAIALTIMAAAVAVSAGVAATHAGPAAHHVLADDGTITAD